MWYARVESDCISKIWIERVRDRLIGSNNHVIKEGEDRSAVHVHIKDDGAGHETRCAGHGRQSVAQQCTEVHLQGARSSDDPKRSLKCTQRKEAGRRIGSTWKIQPPVRVA